MATYTGFNDTCRDIFNSSSNPMYVIDINNYKVKSVNKAAYRDCYSPDATCHSYIMNSRIPCRRDGLACPIEEIKRTGKSVSMEHAFRDEIGEDRKIRFSAYPIMNKDGTFNSILASMEEVKTDEGDADKSLTIKDGIYRHLVQSIQGYIYSINYRDGKPESVYHSPQCRNITGYSQEDYISDPYLWIKMVHPDDVGRVTRFFNDLQAFRQRKPLEHRIIHKKGHVRWIMNTCNIETDLEGNITGAVGFIIDITERKKMDEDLQAAKEAAENANSLKDKFVSLVSHDLKGPISSMKCALQILMEDEMRSGPKSIIEMAINSCNNMSSMINDLLSMSRIKGGMICPQFSFCNGKLAVDIILKRYMDIAARKGVRIFNEIPQTTRLHVDLRLFEEVIGNLLSNAIKFSRKGDSIRIYVGENPPTSIVVEDEGVGIAAEQMTHLFKYEENKSSHGTSGEEGTGLGLPLVHEIMTALGGSLSVEPGKEKGTRFTATFRPVTPRVLILEDEPDILNSMSIMLEGLNIDILGLSTCMEARHGLKEYNPHLVLLDLTLPDGNGIDILKEMKSSNDTRNIPVIVITANRIPDTQDNVFKLGAADYISKPFHAEDFLHRVERFVG